MRTDVMIELVESAFGECLCDGCEILINAGEREYSEVYGSCYMCRKEAAKEIIEILREKK